MPLTAAGGTPVELCRAITWLSNSVALGLAPSGLAVIETDCAYETDGAYEQVDSLKVAFDGAPATGLNRTRRHRPVPRLPPAASSRELSCTPSSISTIAGLSWRRAAGGGGGPCGTDRRQAGGPPPFVTAASLIVGAAGVKRSGGRPRLWCSFLGGCLP